MMSVEFAKNLPDIPRIITALAEWLACLSCIMTMKRRITGWKLVAVCAGFLVVQCAFLVSTDGLEGILWNLCMFAAVCIMYLFIRICLDVERNLAVCCCCAVFVTSEFMASLEWQIWCYVYETLGLNTWYWRSGVLVLVYGILFAVTRQLNLHLSTEEDLGVSFREMIITVITALLTFAVSNLGFLPVNVPFAGRDSVEIFNMRTLVDLGGLAILYAYYAQWRSAYAQHELETIQTILNSQYEQYKQAQRTVDLINYRYHDLKNHIIALRADANAPQRHEYLDKLEHEIQNYEALNKTGNQVLDTLLTSKNLRCMQHKIDMTCVVDGTLFDSMDVMDICSIFGNAIDNAIECELKLKDYSKRMIHVDAFSEKSFLIIRFENYYEGDIRFESGIPVTTKKEKSLHGYGLKSLRYTVHKYKGEVHIDTKDNWFSLRILIPRNIS
nr:sensor histidine kinase [Mediterraneibacter glycyrrhizinilyticus]